MMKKLILWSTGGLCNRLFPLVSAINYAAELGRELLVHWPLDDACQARFNDVFLDKITFVDTNYMNSLIDSETDYFVTHPTTISNDLSMYGRSFLSEKYSLGKVKIASTCRDTEKQNLVIADNTFFSEVDLAKCHRTLLDFEIRPELTQQADDLAENFKLDKTVVGAHVRGSAFGSNVRDWAPAIQASLDEGKRVFMSSEDKDLEDNLANIFPTIMRRDKEYVSKIYPEQDWFYKQSNNFMSKQSVRDGVVDILLLAKTDFKIFKQQSTFSQYIKLLSDGQKNDKL